MPPSILIVEDERIIAKGIEKQLQAFGYVVVASVATGEEAVRAAIDLAPDLILMDIALGAGIDGIDAAGRIRERMDVPLVYLTANSDDATLQRAKLADPFGYLLKPYEDRDLQTAIEMALYRHRMEVRLREQQQWLTAMLSSIGHGVIAIDVTSRVRFMNTVAERLTGWSQFGALDRDIREIFHIVHEYSGDEVRNPTISVLETGLPTALAPNTVLIDRSGARHRIADTATPIRNVDGTVSGAVLLFHEIDVPALAPAALP